MALNYFKQRDIDTMDANSIPDSFFSYFQTLSEERKKEIIESRPELAKPLGYSINENESIQEKEADQIQPEREKTTERIESAAEKKKVNTVNTEKKDIKQEDLFAEIKVNMYENLDLDQVLVDGVQPLEALVLPDNTEKCPLHRCAFEEKQIRYKSKKGGIYGIVLKICRECKRVYLEESRAEYIDEELSERLVIHTFYNKSLTMLYLKSQQLTYQLESNEKVYYPEAWIEENPMCPLHDKKLYDIPCEKQYANRVVKFTGYFCEDCNKILVRKARIPELIDRCAENGIPEIVFEQLVEKKPKKKIIPKREIKPDYFIQDGERQQYNYQYNVDCFRLNEEDTVVVSDSIYCYLEGHHTEEVLAMIMVQQKRGGKKAYLFMLGYCSECQKYYMNIDDYKVVYALGRPEVVILSDLDDDSYQITSGEIFNIEKKHLDQLETKIENEISEIKGQDDYVNPFSVGAYDDGNLSFAKAKSKRKYQPRLTELTGYQDKPYNYRVDITTDGETEIYYIGPSDVDLKDGRKVISFNSDFGHELVNYQTIKIEKDGKEYDIKLSRQFDIENKTLYGYNNIRTDEDIIFRSGVTDPFLVRVLNMRKKQHNLIDIIATIQENQNKIVDADFNKNLIVQGCAGSGKTMVLLHRLSSLQYKNNQFDFGEHALILTPNDEFSLHIKGLAEGLQLGNIERISVEQYYVEVLCRYSEEFKLDAKLSSEMSVCQEYVDYIYSDQFRKDFDNAYQSVITERNTLVERLDNLAEILGQPKRIINFSDDARVIQQMKYAVELMNDKIRQHEIDLHKAEDALERVLDRKKFLEKRVLESKLFAEEVLNESLSRVYIKINTFIEKKQTTISKLELELDGLNEMRVKLEKTLFVFGKKEYLKKLDESIKEVNEKIKDEKDKLENNRSVLFESQEGKSEDEILEWMEKVKHSIRSVGDEIRLCKKNRQDVEKYNLELENDILPKIHVAQSEIDKISAVSYPQEVFIDIQYINKKFMEYTIINTFQMIFDKAVSKFKKEHDVKATKGKYYRYILYARLLFAMKYFNSNQGTTRFMCVDEGQDLAMNEYRLLAEVNSNNVIFNIYGDTNQLMKLGRGITNWSDLKNTFKAEEYVLNENYRNTNQITRFCNSSFGMQVLQTGVDGAKVREIARKDLEEELSRLKVLDERIAILVSRTVQKQKYLNLDLLSIDIKNIIGDEINNGRISVLYVDESKGIEFDRVYVVTANMERNEKYIAYTRALSELVLVIDNTFEEDKDRYDIENKIGYNNEGSKALWEVEKPLKTLPIIERAYQFEGVKNIPLEQIKVIKSSKPKQEKIESLLQYYKQKGELDKPITVSYQEGKYILEDKFLRYYVAEKLGLKYVPCEIGTPKQNKMKDKIRTLNTKIYDSHENEEGVVVEVTLSWIKVHFYSGIEKWYDINKYFESGVVSVIDDYTEHEQMEFDFFKDKNEIHFKKSDISEGDMNVAVSFEGTRKIPMQLIELPYYFKNVAPNPEKVKKMLEYYRSHGELDKPIRVLIQEDKYLLKDRYLRYYIAKKLHFEFIEAIIFHKNKAVGIENEKSIND